MKAIYSEPTFIPDKDSFEVWYALLSDLDYEAVNKATQKWMLNNSKTPKPSDIRGMTVTYGNEELNELSAWSLVSKALKNGYYGAEEEYNKLPEPIQKALGSPAQLRVWAIDEHFNESVVSSNFMRAYKNTLERMKTEKIMGGLNNGIESHDRWQISDGIS